MLEELGFERDVVQPVVTFGKDHLRLDLPPAGGILAVRRSLIVPYSTIRDVRTGEPEWPGPFHLQRIGTFVPGHAALGSFWIDGERRFYFFLKGDRALILDLDEHPYGEIVIGMPDPEALAADVKSQLTGAFGSETQSF